MSELNMNKLSSQETDEQIRNCGLMLRFDLDSNGVKSKRSTNDVIIVGAGVAGSALACSLGKDGRQVVVIERNLNEPNRIVGEVLQPAGYLRLLELGLDDCVRNIDAQRVLGYYLYKDGKSITVSYPQESKHGSNVSGRSFHHGRFVQKMRNKAASLPNVRLLQGTVTSLVRDRGVIRGVRFKCEEGQELTELAPITVVCDGCFSSLRRFLANDSRISRPSYFAGFIIQNLQVPNPNFIHVVMGESSSVIFYPISATEVRFLIDLPGQEMPSISNGQMAHFLTTVVAPQLPPELFDAFTSSVGKSEMRIMPSNCMPASPWLTPGAFLLGDALNMRHSVGGGGMTVALHDVSIVLKLFKHLDLHDAKQVTRQIQHFYNVRKPMAFTMNVVADAFYRVVLQPSDKLMAKQIQTASINYMCLGSVYSRGFVGLFSGLNPHPWKTMLNLFAAIVYIFYSMLLPFPSPVRLRAALRMALNSAAIFIRIAWKEDLVQVFFGREDGNL